LAQTTPIHAIIFQNISLFRETLRLLHKFQNNFGSRALINTKVEGLVDAYVKILFQYSVECLQCTLPNKQQILTEFMAFLNQVWYRLSLESVSKNEAQH